jgi:hypothetical protein
MGEGLGISPQKVAAFRRHAIADDAVDMVAFVAELSACYFSEGTRACPTPESLSPGTRRCIDTRGKEDTALTTLGRALHFPFCRDAARRKSSILSSRAIPARAWLGYAFVAVPGRMMSATGRTA